MLQEFQAPSGTFGLSDLLPTKEPFPSVATAAPNLQRSFLSNQSVDQLSPFGGGFFISSHFKFRMAAPQSSTQPKVLSAWERFFYDGDRLLAEVSLIGSAVAGHRQPHELVTGCAQIQRSHGVDTVQKPLSAFAAYMEGQPEPSCAEEAWQQLLPVADLPDALLFWALYRRLPALAEVEADQRIRFFQRLAMLVYQHRPGRPDLPYQVLIREETGSLLKNAPKQCLKPGQWYSKAESYLPQLQVAWVQGRYEAMWLGSLQGQLDGRFFPLSDHHIRGLSIIGEAERCLQLFQQLYDRCPAEFQLGSVSNMLFMALGSEELPQTFVSTLASHFHQLSSHAFSSLPLTSRPVDPKPLQVQEKPLLVVVSSDLRQHPVGRFWLPIARQLRSQFRVISVAGFPRDQDPIRSELRQLSDEWWPLEAGDLVNTAARIRELSPSLLLDLGGHTADNHPQLLSQRIASVQATYLGFYGPTYAACCDWWIVDRALMAWIERSYPMLRRLALAWTESLYIPDLHGLPDPQITAYQESNHPVYGSFNHTRKLTRSTQERFGALLSANPDAVLQFRSHSFSDPSVRRYFLQRFTDVGIAPHQLQPLPYAPSSAEAMADYGRIHLHLDSSPVSGTTTTLDSIAMGIPVLTCPTKYYAGAISAAILQHAGLADHICREPDQLPLHARWLADRYRSSRARRELARQVRQSPICDGEGMPRMFVEQLGSMLRQKRAA